jgi:hypothetical protein
VPTLRLGLGSSPRHQVLAFNRLALEQIYRDSLGMQGQALRVLRTLAFPSRHDGRFARKATEGKLSTLGRSGRASKGKRLLAGGETKSVYLCGALPHTPARSPKSMLGGAEKTRLFSGLAILCGYNWSGFGGQNSLIKVHYLVDNMGRFRYNYQQQVRGIPPVNTGLRPLT